MTHHQFWVGMGVLWLFTLILYGYSEYRRFKK